MAIDTAERRRSAGGVAFLPLGPGVTPYAPKDASWRQQSGWSYSGISPELPFEGDQFAEAGVGVPTLVRVGEAMTYALTVGLANTFLGIVRLERSTNLQTWRVAKDAYGVRLTWTDPASPLDIIAVGLVVNEGPKDEYIRAAAPVVRHDPVRYALALVDGVLPWRQIRDVEIGAPALPQDGDAWVERVGASPARMLALKLRDQGTTKTIAEITF